RLRDTLTELRWQVREAAGGAEALAHLDAAPAETVVLDSWLPDLEIQEFIGEFERLYPNVDLVTVDDSSVSRGGARSPRRNEILYALRRVQDTDGAAWNSAPVIERRILSPDQSDDRRNDSPQVLETSSLTRADRNVTGGPQASLHRLPEFIGEHPVIL